MYSITTDYILDIQILKLYMFIILVLDIIIKYV